MLIEGTFCDLREKIYLDAFYGYGRKTARCDPGWVKSGVCLKEQEKGVVVLFVASISPGKKEKPLQDRSLVEVEGHTSAVGSFRASPSFKIEAEMTPGQNFSRQGTRCS